MTGNPGFWATVGDVGALGVGARYPDVKYRTEIEPGDSVASTLTTFARRTSAGLLVVGTRGLGGFRGLMMGLNVANPDRARLLPGDGGSRGPRRS